MNFDENMVARIDAWINRVRAYLADGKSVNYEMYVLMIEMMTIRDKYISQGEKKMKNRVECVSGYVIAESDAWELTEN